MYLCLAVAGGVYICATHLVDGRCYGCVEIFIRVVVYKKNGLKWDKVQTAMFAYKCIYNIVWASVPEIDGGKGEKPAAAQQQQ